MKRIIFLFIAPLFIAQFAAAQTSKPAKVNLDYLPIIPLRTKENTAFRAGEKIVFRLHYGMINAGTATITVEDSKYNFGDREAYHIIGEGNSIGSFDWFFKVRDHYETYVDKQGIFPYRFIRSTDEGGYKIFQDYTFHPQKHAYNNTKGESYLTPDFAQDMLSAFYYARTLDLANLKKGEILTVMTVVDDEIYPLKMKYLGKETITVDVGKFNCLRFAPVVQKGRVFKKEEDLSVWITDDANHIPILAKAKLMVGSVKMELTSYSGIANQIAQVQ